MSIFLRLLSESDKAESLKASCNHLRYGENDPRSFEVAPESFDSVDNLYVDPTPSSGGARK